MFFEPISNIVFFSGPTGGVNRFSAGPGVQVDRVVEARRLVAGRDQEVQQVVVGEVVADAEAPVDVRVGVLAELHGRAAEAEAQARIVGAVALELARLHALAGEEFVQRVVGAERRDARPVEQDQVVERVAHAVAVGIRILDRCG